MAIVITFVTHLPLPTSAVRRPRGKRGDGRVDVRPPAPRSL